MPVNMVSHAHGQGYADFHFVIPETVDRLKVYKGPYTAQFGDFATSGTGEFFTKNSIDQNEVKAELGMFDTYRTLGMFKLLDKHHLLSKEKENAYVAGEYTKSLKNYLLILILITIKADCSDYRKEKILFRWHLT